MDNTLICLHCGSPTTNKYCSRKCYSLYKAEKGLVKTFCLICNNELLIKKSRFEKSSKNICCSKKCASKLKIKKFERINQEKIESLGTKLCACGCGEIIRPFYQEGKIVFNNFIHAHNLDEKLLKIAHDSSKNICSKRMREYNKTLTTEQRKLMSIKTGKTLSNKYKEGLLTPWSLGKNKYNSSIIYEKSLKQLGREPWNKGKNKYSDERILKCSLKTQGRTKEKGFLVAINSSKRMKKNNPMKDIKTRIKALTSSSLSPNKPEKLVISKQYPGLVFTGDKSFWVTFKDKTCKNPDFTVRPFRKNKKVIEVWGEYWHKNDDPIGLKKKYREIGIDCLVIPYQKIKNGQFDNEIREFLCI